jgi:hypothetical protein
MNSTSTRVHCLYRDKSCCSCEVVSIKKKKKKNDHKNGKYKTRSSDGPRRILLISLVAHLIRGVLNTVRAYVYLCVYVRRTLTTCTGHSGTTSRLVDVQRTFKPLGIDCGSSTCQMLMPIVYARAIKQRFSTVDVRVLRLSGSGTVDKQNNPCVRKISNENIYSHCTT